MERNTDIMMGLLNDLTDHHQQHGVSGLLPQNMPQVLLEKINAAPRPESVGLNPDLQMLVGWFEGWLDQEPGQEGTRDHGSIRINYGESVDHMNDLARVYQIEAYCRQGIMAWNVVPTESNVFDIVFEVELTEEAKAAGWEIRYE